MSGICGYVLKDKIENGIISKMSNSIKHRGKFINEYKEENFAIANLNHKEKKNYYSKEDKIFISIDGRIERRNEIIKNLNLENATDYQIIKQLYIKYGEDFINYFTGFFALSLYDKEKDILVLARDVIGTKPLYYFYKNDSICYSSELRGIMESPNFKKEINVNALSSYFRLDYIEPPVTIFKDTYKLENGHFLVFKNGKIEDKCYWSVYNKYNELSKNTIKDFNEAKDGLKNILLDNVKTYIKNEKDFGIYLSGGIDSSLVTSLCTECADSQVNTFSIGFYDEERNEAEKSKKIAEHLKTNHHEIYVSEKDFLDVIKKIPEYYDEPFADASEIPIIIINEFGKKNNINIALTGDGADQIFCGSNIYDTLEHIQRIHRLLNPLNIHLNNKFVKQSHFLRRIYTNTDKRNQTQVELKFIEEIFDGLFNDCGTKRFNVEDKINTKSWQEKRLILDINTFLAIRLTTKGDRPSNRNEIELLSPFLTKELLEYSFKVPHKYKYFNKNKKYILKQILYDYVPEELLNATKKGFGIPLVKWLKKYVCDEIENKYTKEFIEKQNIFNYDVLKRMLKEAKEGEISKKLAQLLWDFYIFQLWYERYMI